MRFYSRPIAILFLAAFASTSKGAAQDGERSSFENIAERAENARKAARLEAAAGLYQEAVRLRPDWEDGWWFLGTLNYDLDRYEPARAAFQKFIGFRPWEGPAWAFLGFCEFQLEEHARAGEDVERALALGLGGHEELLNVTWYHAGILRTRFGDFDRGRESLRMLARALGRDPKVIEAWGLNVLRMPLLPREISDERRDLVVMAGDAAYLQAVDRPDEARVLYEQLVRRYADTPNVHYAYGMFLLGSDLDRALEEFKQELQISATDVACRLQLANEHLLRDELDAGLVYAEEVVRMAPQLPAGLHVLGRLLLRQGRIEEATRHLETGVRLAPNHPPLHFALAQAYRQAGRKDDVDRELQTFQRLEDSRRAIEAAESKVRLNPQSPEARLALAQAYELAGFTEEARRERRIHQALLALPKTEGRSATRRR